MRAKLHFYNVIKWFFRKQSNFPTCPTVGQVGKLDGASWKEISQPHLRHVSVKKHVSHAYSWQIPHLSLSNRVLVRNSRDSKK